MPTFPAPVLFKQPPVSSLSIPTQSGRRGTGGEEEEEEATAAAPSPPACPRRPGTPCTTTTGAVLMPQLSPDVAAPAPRNGAGAAYPGVVLMPQLSSSGAAAPTPRDAVAYAYPHVLVEHVGSTLAPATWITVAYPGSGALEAAVNAVGFPGGLSAVAAASENAVGYAIGVHDGGGYDERSGTAALPFAAQAVDGADMDVLLADAAGAEVETAGAAAERARGGLGRLGLAATALAVAGLTAGGTAATPATAMALFATPVAGVTLVTVSVFRA